MTTVQIIGIAAASLVVLLLVVALLVSRRRENAAHEDEPGAVGSFLDNAPQDTLSRLGRIEQPVEDVTVDPGVERARAASAADVTGNNGLGLEWGPESESPSQPAATACDATTDKSEVTGELPVVETAESSHEEDVTTAPSQTAREGHMVPLSDIIVTTSNKMVDLDDQEVRRMLTDLVTFEIDQASEFRRQGQTIDAVLQLTEAEKVSRALGMQESADHIRGMMKEIQGRS